MATKRTSTKPVTTTASKLAEELKVDPKRLRAYLRSNHTRATEAKGTSWAIDAATADAARKAFTPKA